MEPISVASTATETIRLKMHEIGLTKDSVVDAVHWAREKR